MLEQPPFWSLHTHSKYSVNDALPSVDAIVAKAASLDYPALGLTDHGSMSGSIELVQRLPQVRHRTAARHRALRGAGQSSTPAAGTTCT